MFLFTVRRPHAQLATSSLMSWVIMLWDAAVREKELLAITSCEMPSTRLLSLLPWPLSKRGGFSYQGEMQGQQTS